MNRFKKILVVATIFSLFTGIISAEAASKPLVVVKSSSSAKTSTHSKSAGLTKSTFDYAGAVSLTPTTASVYIDLKHGLTQNGCNTFGVSAFKQVGLKLTVFPSHVAVHYNGCEQLKTHKLLPFTVKAKLGDVLTVTSNKETLKITVGSPPVVVETSVTPTPLPISSGTVGLESNTAFNTINIQAISDTQAFLYLDLTGVNPSGCWGMSEEHHTQVGLNVSVVLVFEQNLKIPNCATSKDHAVFPIKIDAKAGDKITVTSGKTTMSAVVRPMIIPTPLPTQTAIPVATDPNPSIKTSLNPKGIDLIVLDKEIFNIAKTLKYSFDSVNGATFCAGITQSYSDYLVGNIPGSNNCQEAIGKLNGSINQANFNMKYVSEKPNSFIYDGSGSELITYLVISNASPAGGKTYDHFKFILVNGKWLADAIKWNSVS